MNKEEYTESRGEEAYEKMLHQITDWRAQHPKEISVANRKWREANLDEVLLNNQETCRKGGKYYKHVLEYRRTGLQGKRNKIRHKHGHRYRQFKRIIAPNSQIHHEWIPGTAEYTGVALVETNPHRYGVIDVIQILEGAITLLTEKKD